MLSFPSGQDTSLVGQLHLENPLPPRDLKSFLHSREQECLPVPSLISSECKQDGELSCRHPGADVEAKKETHVPALYNAIAITSFFSIDSIGNIYYIYYIESLKVLKLLRIHLVIRF